MFRWSLPSRRSLGPRVVFARAASCALGSLLLLSTPAALADETVVVRFELEEHRRPTVLGDWPSFEGRHQPPLHLALSGGGARCLAHLGTLEVLEQEGLVIHGVAGTSGGAIVASLTASGQRPGELAELFRRRNWSSLLATVGRRRQALSLTDDLRGSSHLINLRQRREERRKPTGLFTAAPLTRELQQRLLPVRALCGDEFDRLFPRVRVVTTDLLSGAKYAPVRGDLAALVQGSASVPLALRPVPVGDRLLVDGGLVENLPVETARALGPGVVIASDVSSRVAPIDSASSLAEIFGRSLDIVMEKATADSAARADLYLKAEVQDFPVAEYADNLDDLLDAGRTAARDFLGELWLLLDQEAEPSAHDCDAVELIGETTWTNDEVSERLACPGPLSPARVEALLRVLTFTQGRAHAELVKHDGRSVLRIVVEEPVVVRQHVRRSLDTTSSGELAGQPFTWQRLREVTWSHRENLLDDGWLLPRLATLSWEPETGVLEETWTNEEIVELTVTPDRGKPLSAEKRLARLAGEDLSFRRLAFRLDEIVAQGAVRNWRLHPRPSEDGGLALDVAVERDRFTELGLGAGWHGDLRGTGWAQLRRTNLRGKGASIRLLGSVSKELDLVELEHRFGAGFGPPSLSLDLGGSWFDGSYPVTNRGQRYVEDAFEPHHGGRLWLALLHRPGPSRTLRAQLGAERRHFEATDLLPGEDFDRQWVELGFDWDGEDRLDVPTRGGRLRTRAELGLGGDRLDRLQLSGRWSFSLPGEVVVSPELELGLSAGARRRPLLLDPGGHSDVYGVVPYGAAAAQFARTGLRIHRPLFERGPLSVRLELGADVLRTAASTRDLRRVDETLGYGLSLVGQVGHLGPVVLGWARSDEGADLVFITAGSRRRSP
ncbi:MAG: patatin-like phospholipase family protein [Acidobacteriota bacterium]